MQLHAKRQQGHHAVLALGVGMVSFGLFMVRILMTYTNIFFIDFSRHFQYKSTNIVNFHGTPPATYE